MLWCSIFSSVAAPMDGWPSATASRRLRSLPSPPPSNRSPDLAWNLCSENRTAFWLCKTHPMTGVIKCPHWTSPNHDRYMVYNGYYKVMSNIPKMGHLTTPEWPPNEPRNKEQLQNEANHLLRPLRLSKPSAIPEVPALAIETIQEHPMTST